MDMTPHERDKPEKATAVDAHKELAIIATWARVNGMPNVYYRINWALRALMTQAK